MDLQFNAEEEAFRLKVRGWLAENMPKDFAVGREGREDKEWLGEAKSWQRKVYDAGYVALAWPKEYGGEKIDPGTQKLVKHQRGGGRAAYPGGGAGRGGGRAPAVLVGR